MSIGKLLFATACGGLLFSSASHAALGDSLYAAGGDVTITFEGSDAAYDSLISINGGVAFFPNHGTAGGAVVDLGTFAAGTLLDVALTVSNTGHTFHTGSGASNPDGIAHANVIYNYQGVSGLTYVGFEDLFGGGDKDYNDHQFAFTMIAAPVPEARTFALLAGGLAGLAVVMRRRRR